MADIYGYSVQEKKQQFLIKYDLINGQLPYIACSDWNSLVKELNNDYFGIYRTGIEVGFRNLASSDETNYVTCSINDFEARDNWLVLEIPNNGGYIEINYDESNNEFSGDFTAFLGLNASDRILAFRSVEGTLDLMRDAVIYPNLDIDEIDRIDFLCNRFQNVINSLDVTVIEASGKDLKLLEGKSYLAKAWFQRKDKENLDVHLTTSEGDYVLTYELVQENEEAGE